MIVNSKIKLALHHLRIGVIAHPTDTIYGLGCLANNTSAIQTIINLKKRDAKKGFILLASNISFLTPYIDSSINSSLLKKLAKPTDTPTTYLVPKSDELSPLLSGDNDLLAVRITSDPLITYFCENTGSALISTSANLHGKKVAKTTLELKSYFGNDLAFELPPNMYNSVPSKIINLMTGEQLR